MARAHLPRRPIKWAHGKKCWLSPTAPSPTALPSQPRDHARKKEGAYGQPDKYGAHLSLWVARAFPSSLCGRITDPKRGSFRAEWRRQSAGLYSASGMDRNRLNDATPSDIQDDEQNGEDDHQEADEEEKRREKRAGKQRKTTGRQDANNNRRDSPEQNAQRHHTTELVLCAVDCKQLSVG